jgi:hypothetical protein
MKKIAKQMSVLIAAFLFMGFTCLAQSTTVSYKLKSGNELHTYVIERNIPGAGQFSPEKLKAISETSCTVLTAMGPSIQWLHSYVTADKIFCVYKAENIELIKEHAKRGGFPANAIYEVSAIISPATAKN